MKFCSVCAHAIKRNVSGQIRFICECGNTEIATLDDMCLSTQTYLGEHVEGQFDILIRNAALDPASTKILKDCPECDLDFMTQVRIGDDKFVSVCECGYIK